MFVALGKRLSIEVAVFVVLAFFVARYIFIMVGPERFEGMVSRLDLHDKLVRNYQEMWWEKLLIHWAQVLGKINAFLAEVSFPDVFKKMKQCEYVSSPFSSLAIVWAFLISLISMIVVIPLSYRREV